MIYFFKLIFRLITKHFVNLTSIQTFCFFHEEYEKYQATKRSKTKQNEQHTNVFRIFAVVSYPLNSVRSKSSNEYVH